MAMFRQLSPLLFATLPLRSAAFFQQFFQQAGGGQHHFQFGGGGMPQMQQQRIWPRGVEGEIGEEFEWLKGCTFHWNKWQNVKFEEDGKFTAPDRFCQGEQCKWCTHGDKVYVHWGQQGMHVLKAKNLGPEGQAVEKTQLYGKRKRDNDKVRAKFVKREYEEEMDPYEVLGIDQDATDREIKKRFRRLSIKYHPDKNPSEEAKEMYAKINEANEILSDPDKRILYDTGGMEAVEQHAQQVAQGGGGMDPFAAFFGGGRGNNKRGKKGDDSKSVIKANLEDLYNGHELSANLSRRIVCRGCRKKKDGKCAACKRCPDETKMVNRQMGPGMVVQQQVRVKSKELCRNDKTTLKVLLEKGMADGAEIKFERMAEQTPGQIPGDVIFVVKERRHRLFRRNGNDLEMSLDITLKEALLGFRKVIKHLDGHEVVLESSGSSVTIPNEVMRVKGEGMPVHNFPSTFGDLYVKINVKFPRSLSAEQVAKINDAL